MNILENELVLKYFTPEYKAYYPCNDKTSQMDAAAWDKCAMAASVLRAMQEPISPGEKYLEVVMGNLELKTWNHPFRSFEYFCPQVIRLPDKFQRVGQGCKHEVIECVNCAKPFPQHPILPQPFSPLHHGPHMGIDNGRPFDAVESENRRLRVALEKIAKGFLYERHSGMDSGNVSATRDHLRLWAKAALEENGEKK